MSRVLRTTAWGAVGRAVVAGGAAVALGCACSRDERAPADPAAVVLPPASAVPGGAGRPLPTLELGPPPVPPEKKPLGEEVRLRDYTFTAFEVAPCPPSTAFPPPAGTRRIGVRVKVVGRSEQEVPVGALYASIDAGQHGPVRAELGGCPPALVATHVTRGQVAEGWLSFDVPELGTGLTLLYAPTIVGSGPQVAAVALP